MRFFMVVLIALLPSLMFAQLPADDLIKALIAKLGSTNFQEREAATKSLRTRPEAAAAIRQKLKSPDAETRRRAAEILEYYNRQPLRDLDAAAKEGRVERFTELLAGWPQGKYESEAWFIVRDFSRNLTRLHQKKGGNKIALSVNQWDDLDDNLIPHAISAKRITELFGCRDDHICYLRAGEVDLEY